MAYNTKKYDNSRWSLEMEGNINEFDDEEYPHLLNFEHDFTLKLKESNGTVEIHAEDYPGSGNQNGDNKSITIKYPILSDKANQTIAYFSKHRTYKDMIDVNYCQDESSEPYACILTIENIDMLDLRQLFILNCSPKDYDSIVFCFNTQAKDLSKKLLNRFKNNNPDADFDNYEYKNADDNCYSYDEYYPINRSKGNIFNTEEDKNSLKHSVFKISHANFFGRQREGVASSIENQDNIINQPRHKY